MNNKYTFSMSFCISFRFRSCLVKMTFLRTFCFSSRILTYNSVTLQFIFINSKSKLRKICLSECDVMICFLFTRNLSFLPLFSFSFLKMWDWKAMYKSEYQKLLTKTFRVSKKKTYWVNNLNIQKYTTFNFMWMGNLFYIFCFWSIK